MPASQDPNLGINYGWTLGESTWNSGMDANLKKLGALVFLSVISATTTTPPGTPAEGDRYLIPSGSAAPWDVQIGDIAVYVDGAWEYYTPSEGWYTRAEDTQQQYVYSSSSWALEGSLYGQYADDSAAATGGVPVGGIYVNSSTGALSVRLV